ncbi:hypothetical protein T492DRAFT_1148920, partial [Pavlovales sp. CCMP2436]
MSATSEEGAVRELLRARKLDDAFVAFLGLLETTTPPSAKLCSALIATSAFAKYVGPAHAAFVAAAAYGYAIEPAAASTLLRGHCAADSLASALEIFEYVPALDARALEALANAAMRATPKPQPAVARRALAEIEARADGTPLPCEAALGVVRGLCAASLARANPQAVDDAVALVVRIEADAAAAAATVAAAGTGDADGSSGSEAADLAVPVELRELVLAASLRVRNAPHALLSYERLAAARAREKGGGSGGGARRVVVAESAARLSLVLRAAGLAPTRVAASALLNDAVGAPLGEGAGDALVAVACGAGLADSAADVLVRLVAARIRPSDDSVAQLVAMAQTEAAGSQSESFGPDAELLSPLPPPPSRTRSC